MQTSQRNLEAAAPQTELSLKGTADIELAAAGEDGKAKRPTFSMKLYGGGTMNVGWGRPVVIDLAGLRATEAITALLNHDRNLVVGQSTAVDISAAGVTVTGVVTGDTEERGSPAQTVVSHARNGFRWPVSIGTSNSRVEAVEAGNKVKVNGREFQGPLYVVRASVLREGSFVSLGADETASAQIAAAAAGDYIMDFKQWLQAMGLDEATLSEDQKAKLKAKFDAEQVPPKTETPKKVEAGAVNEDPLAQVRATQAAETRRVDGIRKACAGKYADIEAKAIEEGWEVTRAELEVLRAERPTAPAGHVHQSQAPTSDVLEAALCMSAKLPDVEKAFKPETLQAAHTAFRGRIGIGETLLLMAEAAEGRRFSLRRDPMTEILHAAFSSRSLAGILSNTANKFMMAGYTYGDNADLQICAIRNVSDFKTVTSYRMTGADEFQEVAPSGELKHGTLGEESYTNRARTYGLMFGIPREDIINDDLGAFDQLRTKVGMGAAKKRRKVIWTLFLNNAAFFTAGRNNYLTGAGTVLGIDALTAAEKALAEQKDADNTVISLMGKLLLVPTALGAMATSLYKSQEMRDTTASTKSLTTNIHQNKYTPVVTPFIGAASGITGGSDTAHYLLADPNEAATLELCFLNGVQSPTIEAADADFNILGIQLRGYFDFGAGMQDHRAGVKSRGT